MASPSPAVLHISATQAVRLPTQPAAFYFKKCVQFNCFTPELSINHPCLCGDLPTTTTTTIKPAPIMLLSKNKPSFSSTSKLQQHLSMASSSSSSLISLMLVIFLVATTSFIVTSAGNFNQYFDITWGDGRGKILNNGQHLTLSLDKSSGSGFQSKRQYLFGKVDMQLKLVPGNSAGTVTAYYLSSQGPTHDEIDFEFLGNLSGDPYTLHTNVFTQGKGNREQQFHLWFDPTADFHTYSILWNPRRIIFSVDGTPIREFKNLESIGVPFPKNQPMRIYSSLWNADDWATRGGLVKTDWSHAPFTASYRNFNANTYKSNPWFSQQLDSASQMKMKRVQKKYMVYNYCADTKRFSQGFPPECARNNV